MADYSIPEWHEPLPTPTTGPPSKVFGELHPMLQSHDTQLVYIGVAGQDGRRPWWDLWGPRAGRQGVELGKKLQGVMHVPFEQIMSESPYQVGSWYERVDYGKREISFRAMIGVHDPDTTFRYRLVEDRWWRSWSATEDGYFGVYTRTHGWRFLRVRLAEAPNNPFDLDPAAHGNNYMEWDMTAVAADPYWRKRIPVDQWVNEHDEDGNAPPNTPWDDLAEYFQDLAEGLLPGISDLIPGWNIGEGNIVLPNRGDVASYPMFVVSSPGRCWIQDGPSGDMIELPLLGPDDGYILVDTNPVNRTITSATDPVDPLLFQIARNSQFLDFFLHDITHSTLPVWRRFDKRFTTPWPPRKIARIKVRHSNSEGSVTGLMPQRFSSAYA